MVGDRGGGREGGLLRSMVSEPDDDAEDPRNRCCVCGKVLGTDGPWVQLNRVVVGTGKNSRSSSFQNPAGEYLWEVPEDRDDWYVTGPILCFPACLVSYFEGEMVEIDWVMRSKE
jgi:hypothetical protein